MLPTNLFVKPIDTHQFVHPISCHPYHRKPGITISQTLKQNGICSDNSNFNNQRNALERWLLEKGYIGKMVRKQILRSREPSRESPLEKVKLESNEQKVTFNTTYCLVFQNVKSILQELHILLKPDQEHKKVFKIFLL